MRYWADRQIFLKDAKLGLETLHQRARQTAFLVPGLTIVVRDERGLDGEGKTEETFRFDGGISEFCEYLAQDKAVCDVLRLTGQGTFKETVPVLDERGHMTATEVTRELVVDIAMRWGTGYDTNLKSFVNIIATPKGGTHVTGFERSVTKTVNEVLRSAKLLRVAEDDIVKDDALEGLTAVVTVRLAEPQFEGQTKEVLGTSAANRIVANVVAKELKAFLTSTKRDAKAQARAVLDKAVAAARTRIAARQHKDAQRRKTALESSSPLLPSLPTAAVTTWSAVSCSSSRETRRWVLPSSPGTPSSRHCCRFAARFSTSRRRPSRTCSRTLSAARSSRS